MRHLLDALYLAALLALSPWLLWRCWRTGRYRRGLRDKLAGFRGDAPAGAVWFHGVSVGEVVLLRQLVAAFRARHPSTPVVVSASTDTGLEEARKSFPDLTVFAFPFDLSWAVGRTLAAVRPSLVVLAEGELWPNFLLAARRHGVPVAVVNGRMSPRSLARYKLLAPLARWVFAAPALYAAQTDEYAAAVLSLGGVPGRVVVTGNVKYDGAITDRRNPRTAALRELLAVRDDDLVWIAGSTQAPEEEIVLGVYRRAKERFANLRLFLVPRHRDRFDEVARLVEKAGLPLVRRSALAGPPDAGAVVLVDSTGELSALWGLAQVAFVGGSLDGKRGGQNMIEPAAFGAAVTFGPHVWNFARPAAMLTEVGGACQARDAAGLERDTLRLLGDAGERKAVAAAGRALVLVQQGATARTLDRLAALLPARAEAA